MLTRQGALQDGWTPLYAAVLSDQDAISRVLLEAGADITAKDKVCERGLEGGRRCWERRDFGES